MNYEEYIKFIIDSRNDIAHGSEKITDYEEAILKKFPEVQDSIDMLQNSTLYIRDIFSEILNFFEDKYMHNTKKMI